MNDILLIIILIFIFILIGGVFAAAEMALVSLRDAQVKQLSHRGQRGRSIARLAANPNRYLSAVQVGVTLMGFLSAAYGGESLSGPLGKLLGKWTHWPDSATKPLSLVLITIAISYFSIVIGELTAKRLAMQRAEGFSLALGPFVDFLATVLRPVIWLLGVSTDVLVRLLGGDPKASREAVSNEEIRAMVSGAESLSPEERQIVDDVFDAGERSLREVMVPRTEVEFLPGDMPAYKAIKIVQGAPHSRYPVTNGSTDEIAGFLHVRDLMDLDSVTRGAPVAQLARPVFFLPETVKVLRALTTMRRNRAHLAIVQDEYGGTAGIVTLEDLVEELVGDITDEYDVVAAATSDPGDIDGLTTLEQFEEMSGHVLPEGPYDTVAGYVMSQLGKVPEMGDAVECDLQAAIATDAEPIRFTFKVTGLDGRRTARVSVRRAEVGQNRG